MTTPADSNQAPSSQRNPAPSTEASSDLKERIQWLVQEQAAAASKETKALLCYESALLRERAGDEPGAARDYLAAYNADPSFREPVEALAALLRRRKSYKNLGKLLDALVRAASGPEQAARAYMEQAAYLLEHNGDVGAARAAFEHAVEQQPDAQPAWLELEVIAGKTADADLRIRALEQRIEQSEPGQWKALLLTDLAKLVHQQGDADRAIELLNQAADMPTAASYHVQLVLEAIARREGRDELLALTLENQAEMLLGATIDAEAGDLAGIPLHVRSAGHIADVLMRAADAKRRAGDVDGAVALVDRALSKLPEDVVLLSARLRLADLLSDVESAATFARKLLDRGVSGKTGASLWMRLFEAAAAKGDRDEALEALQNALKADAGSVAARALQLDLLVDLDPPAFAASLQAMATDGLSDEAKGRAHLLAAWAWAVRANDAAASKAALVQAGACGVEPGVLARVGRALASMVEDESWCEQATRALLAAGAQPAEQAGLWLELVRARLAHNDREGAAEALDALASAEGGLWIGRVLAAYALGLVTGSSDEPPKASLAGAEALEKLAACESDPVTARALSVAAALRRVRLGHHDGAMERLRQLHAADAADVLVAVLLSDLLRMADQPLEAAQVLSACAAACDEPDLGAALHLEAAILLWRANARDRAIDELGASQAQRPGLAASMLLWATAAVDPDSLEARRRVLELGEECGADKVATALERMAAEASEEGDEQEAHEALEALERDALGELGVAGWLGRLVLPHASEEPQARERALEQLATLGITASAVVAAERYRLAATMQQDRDAALDHAKSWALADGGPVAAFEWAAAARAAEDPQAESLAYRLLARHVEGLGADAMMAQASVLELLDAPATQHPAPLDPAGVASQLVNLELAPAGCDPRRRAAALTGLSDVLGEECKLDALVLAGWSQLAAGQYNDALASFQRVTQARPTDLAAWEGLRAAAESVGQLAWQARACEQLGELCINSQRAAAFFETAALLWLDQLHDEQRGELALEQAFSRDPKRFVAFDRLFRRVRARKQNDHLLEIIAKRLEVAENTQEIAKLFWEQARVLRQKGDFEGAIAALDNVTMLEPDHVGALALSGEMHIRRGEFPEAVEMLARLASHPEAPAQQRLVSGMAAVDVCENKLNDDRRAFEVLMTLQNGGLSTMPVREKLARAAAKTGNWLEATRALETLMTERSTSEARVEAARLAMVIHRDKIGDSSAATAAVSRLLQEVPDDAEALDLLITHQDVADKASRAAMLERARKSIVGALVSGKLDADRVELLARIAQAQNNSPLRQAAVGALVALGRGTETLSRELDGLDRRVARTPQVAIDDTVLKAIGDERDSGPIAELFQVSAETIAAALGPTLAGLGVTKRERIDPRDGLPLRNEIAHWAGALGLEFDLYVGGRDPKGVTGVPGSPPMLVVGSDITAPLSPAARQAVARELFALKRGINVIRTRDDATVACIVVALCRLVDVPIDSPPYAMLAETQRMLSRELPRKLKKILPEYCQAVAASGVDPRVWVAHAFSSLDRMAAIAAGDVSLVLSDVFGAPRERLASVCAEQQRARRLISFVLSDRYLELRSRLGMGVQ